MNPRQPHTNVPTFWRNEVGWTRDTRLHGITSQKAVFFTATTMKTSIWHKDNKCDGNGVRWRFTHVTCQLPISSGQNIMKRGTGVKCLSVTCSYVTYPDNRDKQKILRDVHKSQSGYMISHPKTVNFIRYSVFCNMWSTCQYVSNTCQTHSKMRTN
jgi:hypothetical protein